MEMECPRAVVMAGGRSKRMRAGGESRHKALLEIDGVPLIAYNFLALARRGFRDMLAVASSAEPELCAFLRCAGAAFVERLGATLEVMEEHEPRGNIGILADVARDREALVVYCDNVSALYSDDVLRTHRAAGAALTFAVHRHALKNPYGELALDDAGAIVDYAEKPVRIVTISSGTCVVGPAAARLLPRQGAFGAADLFALVHHAGLPVAGHVHEAAWVDVNEPAALGRAREIVRDHPALFGLHARAAL